LLKVKKKKIIYIYTAEEREQNLITQPP